MLIWPEEHIERKVGAVLIGISPLCPPDAPRTLRGTKTGAGPVSQFPHQAWVGAGRAWLPGLGLPDEASEGPSTAVCGDCEKAFWTREERCWGQLGATEGPPCLLHGRG